MNKLISLISLSMLISCADVSTLIPDSYNHVDQVLWVVADLDNTITNYKQLGFTGILDMGTAQVTTGSKERSGMVRLARANLGGAIVNWIQPLDGKTLFSEFQINQGDGAMSLVHRFPGQKELNREVKRLEAIGIDLFEEIEIRAGESQLQFTLMETAQGGKYTLGLTGGRSGMESADQLSPANRHDMKLNQYAFAVRDPDPVSVYWHKLGLPEFEINHPELGKPVYYGEPADHELIQGWQRHGSISYEWCIPVKPPTVYEDHILRHGEGIQHLAFSVEHMDEVLDDYRSRGYVVSMGGTWGEEGKPGSGRYEYIDLEEAGGLTIELLWNYSD